MKAESVWKEGEVWGGSFPVINEGGGREKSASLGLLKLFMRCVWISLLFAGLKKKRKQTQTKGYGLFIKKDCFLLRLVQVETIFQFLPSISVPSFFTHCLSQGRPKHQQSLIGHSN